MSFTRSVIVSLRQSRVLLRSNTTTTTTALKHNRLMSNLIQKNSTCLHRTNPLGHQNLQFLKPICTRSMATKTAEQATETESDQEMSEFLEEEISIEYQNKPDIPKLEEFDVEVKGSQVTLTKKFGKETVTVTFDINENENVDEMPEEDVQDEDSFGGDIVSYPHFTIKITKPSGKSIEFDCVYEFPEQHDEQGDVEEQETHAQEQENHAQEQENDEQEASDIFRFDFVSVLNSGQTSKDDGVYKSETVNMDGILYDNLMNMLAERGVGAVFAQDLIRLSTALEHDKHVEFLEDLKQFAEEDLKQFAEGR